MRFLSVAERELRAAARQRWTHRLRWMTATIFFLLLVWLMWTFNSFRAPQVFGIFLVITFFYCLLMGATRSADCISSERREGTLGLLFLTNLNGPEIIAGKLCSGALSAAYGFFAIFPLLALQMLIGGITLAQFSKSLLSLFNVIFFSVATGFLASSISVRQFTAVSWANGLALFFSVGLMAIGALAHLTKQVWANGPAVFSPLYSLIAAEGTTVLRGNYYWWSVACVHALSWLFLGLATWRLSRSWRDGAPKVRFWHGFKGSRRWRERGQSLRRGLRRRLLQINPFFWLGSRQQVSAPLLMVLVVLVVAATSWVAAPFFGRVLPAGAMGPLVGHLFAWLWAGLIIHGLVLYYAATVTSRRLAEDKQSGALELVLSTPTAEGSIWRGLWMAYGRRMLFPGMIAVLVHLFFIWQGATLAVLDPDAPTLPAGTRPGELFWHALLDQPIGGRPVEWFYVFALRLLLLLLLLVGLVWLTLGSLGPWLGLRMKHPGFAPLLSLALVIVPPVMVFSFFCFVADEVNLDKLPERLFLPIMLWTAFGIGVVHCCLLFWWAAGRLRTDFRTVVTSRFQPPSLRRWWRPTRRGMVRFAGAVLSLAVALVLLVVGFYFYQNWQSRRAFAAFEKHLQQRNQPLDLAAYLPGPVDPNQNFALTPAFRRWVDPPLRAAETTEVFKRLEGFQDPGKNSGTIFHWPIQLFLYQSLTGVNSTLSEESTDAALPQAWLQNLEPGSKLMGELATAARLPYFQPTSNRTASAVLELPKAEINGLERLHLMFQLRACALLELNRADEAAADVVTGLHLVRLARQTTSAEAFQITQMLLVRSLQPLWEGMARQRWTFRQLTEFQQELSSFNFLVDYTNTLHGVVLAHVESWRRFAAGQDQNLAKAIGQRYGNQAWQMQPRAWWLQDCVHLYSASEEIKAGVDVARSHVPFYIWTDVNNLPLDQHTTYLLQPGYSSSPPGYYYPPSIPFTQTAVNQATLACALERYRLDRGNHPETLDELIPAYLPAIPRDVARGKPLLYDKTAAGRFILRSTGPNQVDDRKNPTSDDWLWAFPTNAPPGNL